MWKATLNSVSKEGGNVVANVTLSRDDGDLETITRDIPADSLNEEYLGKYLGNIVASRTKRDAGKEELEAKVGKELTIILPA